MLVLFHDLTGYTLDSKGDEFGSVDDIYFDDATWKLRGLVAHTGTWFFGKRVLIPSEQLDVPHMDVGHWPIKISRKEVEEHGTDADDTPPVSVQERRKIYGTATSPFIIAPGADGFSPMLTQAYLARSREEVEAEESKTDGSSESHLRSMREITGYTVQGRDGTMGTVGDFVIDVDGWRVACLVIDRGKWLPGKQAVVSTHVVNNIDWHRQLVEIALEEDVIETCPTPMELKDMKRDDINRFLTAVAPVV